MIRPLTKGIIAEVLTVCTYDRVLRESIDLAASIKNGDESLKNKPMCSMFDFDEVAATPKFWQEPIMMNNLVAHVLERITMEVANPILEAVDGMSPDDIAAICACTNELQVRVVPEVMERCSAMWTRLTIRPVGEARKERDVAMEQMAQGDLFNALGILESVLSGFHGCKDDNNE